MGVWSKVLSLTASCLSPLPSSESQLGHVRKLPVTMSYAAVFDGYSGCLHQLQLDSHDLATIWQKKCRKTIFQSCTISTYRLGSAVIKIDLDLSALLFLVISLHDVQCLKERRSLEFDVDPCACALAL